MRGRENQLAPLFDGIKRDATVAEAGKRSINNQTMNTTSTLSLTYRKQLADLLKKYGPLHDKAEASYQSKYRDVEQSVLSDYVEEKMGSQLVSEIAAAQAELDSFKESLSTIGVEINDGSLEIGWTAPDSLKKRIRDLVERQIGRKSDLEARFESARFAVLTVPTLEDAKKVLDSVSELCG